MSYQTNPILNRIKITKGWKDSHFPTTKWTPREQDFLGLKKYLFLTAFLKNQKIRLWRSDFRISEIYTKLASFCLSKQIVCPQNAKSKWKAKSFLQKIQSSLSKIKNKKGRFLLYRDLKQIKTKSELFSNITCKIFFSKKWLSKPRFSSWINFSHQIHFGRQDLIKKQNRFWKKKLNLSFSPQNKSENITRHVWWKKTQKNLFFLLGRFKKEIFFLKKFLDFCRQKFYLFKDKFFFNLKKQYHTKLNFLKSLTTWYQMSFKTKIQNQSPKKTFSLFKEQSYLKSRTEQQKNTSFFLKKKINFLQKILLFGLSKTKSIFMVKNTRRIPLFKESLKTLVQNFILSHIKKKLWQFNSNYRIPLKKIRLFKKPTRLRKTHLFKFLRLEQKKSIYSHQKTQTQNRLAYRLAFRYNYRKSLALKTHLKFKYLIQNVIQNYFSSFVFVKSVWPVKEFKNLKFYRLFFPAYKQKNLKKKPFMRTKNLRSKNKKYVAVGQVTNRLKIKNQNQDPLFKPFSWPLNNNKTDNLQPDPIPIPIPTPFPIPFPPLPSVDVPPTPPGNGGKDDPFFPWPWPEKRKPKKKEKPVPKRNDKKRKDDDGIMEPIDKNQEPEDKPWWTFALAHFGSANALAKCLAKRFPKDRPNQIWPKIKLPLSKAKGRKFEKINPQFKLKKKVIQTQNENRLFFVSKQKFTPNFISTVMVFKKYLDPQPLTQHLAEIISDTKKHAFILIMMKIILRAMHMKRGLGYQVKLNGRVNGRNKTKRFSFDKLKRSRPRQTFSKTVNSALSQACASIGAFGIKMLAYA